MTFRTIPNGRLVDGAKLDNLPADVNAELASKADIVDLNAHKTDFNNPHSVTKSQVGLGNVDNTSDADKPVSTATQTALNAKEDKANKGQPNGYAPLDATGKVPAANLPAGTGTGDVVGPASSTDSNVAVFDGVTGKLVKDGGHSLSEYVPKTTTVNGKALSSDVSLTASDVGAPSGSGTSSGNNTGDQDLSGLVPKTRTLTINGTTYDLSDNRTWTVGGASIIETQVFL